MAPYPEKSTSACNPNLRSRMKRNIFLDPGRRGGGREESLCTSMNTAPRLPLVLKSSQYLLFVIAPCRCRYSTHFVDKTWKTNRLKIPVIPVPLMSTAHYLSLDFADTATLSDNASTGLVLLALRRTSRDFSLHERPVCLVGRWVPQPLVL